MPKQDPRVSKDAEEWIEDFFISIANNANELIQTCLKEEPTLIYARDPDTGGTAITHLLASRRPQDPQTLNIILDTAREMGVTPDFTIKSTDSDYNARDAYDHIKDPALKEQFNRVLLNHGFNIMDVEPAPTPVYSEAERAQKMAREDAYFKNNHETHQTIAKMNQGSKIGSSKKKGGDEKCIVSTALNDEDSFYDSMSKVLKSLPHLNMQEQKKLDQYLHEQNLPFANSHDLSFFGANHPLNGISFKELNPASASNDLSLVVIPKELLDLSLSQIQEFIGRAYEYLFGAENN